MKRSHEMFRMISLSHNKNQTFTYIQLPAGYNHVDMQANFQSILKENVNPIFENFGITINYELQKITATK